MTIKKLVLLLLATAAIVLGGYALVRTITDDTEKTASNEPVKETAPASETAQKDKAAADEAAQKEKAAAEEAAQKEKQAAERTARREQAASERLNKAKAEVDRVVVAWKHYVVKRSSEEKDGKKFQSDVLGSSDEIRIPFRLVKCDNDKDPVLSYSEQSVTEQMESLKNENSIVVEYKYVPYCIGKTLAALFEIGKASRK
jgi:vacuolar-type H+-ATPase subunit E/Vma4